MDLAYYAQQNEIFPLVIHIHMKFSHRVPSYVEYEALLPDSDELQGRSVPSGVTTPIPEPHPIISSSAHLWANLCWRCQHYIHVKGSVHPKLISWL